MDKFELSNKIAEGRVLENPKTIKDPNFSVIVPGPCNARCKFCFWSEKEPVKGYLEKLKDCMESLPPQFYQLSITGGEPSMSSYLGPILGAIDRKRFKKVVLTTNGTNLRSIIPIITGIVDHINISRHSPDDKVNASVFEVEDPKGPQVPSTEELTDLCDQLNQIGIDVTISAVTTKHFKTKEDVFKMVDYTKSVGASALFLRKPHGNLEPSNLEKSFSSNKTIRHSSCPVCETTVQLIRGLPVSWKRSVLEPSKVLGDEVYEGVFHTDGRMTSDWDGEIEVRFTKPDPKPDVRLTPVEPIDDDEDEQPLTQEDLQRALNRRADRMRREAARRRSAASERVRRRAEAGERISRRSSETSSTGGCGGGGGSGCH